LADVFALYIKTKNFHWHASGPHFRDEKNDRATIDSRELAALQKIAAALLAPPVTKVSYRAVQSGLLLFRRRARAFELLPVRRTAQVLTLRPCSRHVRAQRSADAAAGARR
jgi:hypothetical protein